MLLSPRYQQQQSQRYSIFASSSHNAYLPIVPSPLSPRSGNAHGWSSHHGAIATESKWGVMADAPSQDGEEKENVDASATTPSTFTTAHSPSSLSTGASFHGATLSEPRAAGVPLPFSKRAVKKAPTPRQDDLRERRRGQFLKKVREGREDRRFEARGEDVLRAEYLRQRREWEGEMAVMAPVEQDEADMEDVSGWDDLPVSSAQSGGVMSVPGTQRDLLDEEEIEEVAGWEDGELDALLEFMPGYMETNTTTTTEEARSQKGLSEHFGSDDEDFEALFSELMEHDSMSQEQPAQNAKGGLVPSGASQGEAMDMS